MQCISWRQSECLSGFLPFYLSFAKGWKTWCGTLAKAWKKKMKKKYTIARCLCHSFVIASLLLYCLLQIQDSSLASRPPAFAVLWYFAAKKLLLSTTFGPLCSFSSVAFRAVCRFLGPTHIFPRYWMLKKSFKRLKGPLVYENSHRFQVPIPSSPWCSDTVLQLHVWCWVMQAKVQGYRQ